MASYLVLPGATALALDLNQVILLTNFWDITGKASATVSGGTIVGAGPLGRGPADYWQCTATSQTLTVDLGSSRTLRGVSFGTFYRTDTTKIPAGFALDYSANGTSWTNLVTVTGNSAPAITVIPNGNASFSARYVRLTVTAFQAGQSSAVIAGFQVFSHDDAAGFGQLPLVLDENGYIQNRIGTRFTICGPLSTPALTVYASGGVDIGTSGFDKGAGNLNVQNNLTVGNATNVASGGIGLAAGQGIWFGGGDPNHGIVYGNIGSNKLIFREYGIWEFQAMSQSGQAVAQLDQGGILKVGLSLLPVLRTTNGTYHLEVGVLTAGTSTAGSGNVTFASPFISPPPAALVGRNDAFPSDGITVTATSISSTGMTISWGNNSNNRSLTFSWVAIGP